MACEIFDAYIPADYSAFLLAMGPTVLCCVLGTALIFRAAKRGASDSRSRSCGNGASSFVGDGGRSRREMATGSLTDVLAPEITSHIISYLDYRSLCRLSMTNSLMRNAANDDNTWKALYYKDFSPEHGNIIPPNGWKAYYAATKAVIAVNVEFFRIIEERLLPEMGQLWLNAGYVKCFHASGHSFSGYDVVMGSWQIALSWEDTSDFSSEVVNFRVGTDMAWITMKVFF